jgi:glycosyltransferase involved in cell wall biosynthesis
MGSDYTKIGWENPLSPKKVLMIVNTYALDDSRVIFTATSLTRMGYQVKLLGAVRQQDKDVAGHMVVDEVDVWIMPTVSSYHPINLLREMWQLLRGKPGEFIQASSHHYTNLLSFLFLNLWLLRLGLSGQTHVVHCHDLSPLLAGWLIAAFKRTRLIYDAHENVPTMYTGRKGRMMGWLERFLVPKTDVCISAGERLERALIKRGAQRTIHIGNWKRLTDYEVNPERLTAVSKKYKLNRYKLVISLIGTLDATREIEPLLEAVRQSPNVALLIGGRGSEQDKVIAATKAPNIHWLGWIDLMEIPMYTHLSDVIYYCRTPQHFGGSYELAPAPNKLYEAFAAGKALIARRGAGEIGEILEAIPAGILLDEVTPETLKATFVRLQDENVLRSLQEGALAARKQYNWSVAEDRLRKLYSELTV